MADGEALSGGGAGELRALHKMVSADHASPTAPVGVPLSSCYCWGEGRGDQDVLDAPGIPLVNVFYVLALAKVVVSIKWWWQRTHLALSHL